jgi:hypothetical protein
MLSILLVEDEARDVELANGTVEEGNGGLFCAAGPNPLERKRKARTM